MNILVLQKSKSSTDAIAGHLCTRMHYGKVVIIADEPKVFIALLRKKWLSLIRKTQKERASTLDPAKVADLENRRSYMLGMRFTIHYPPDEYHADVYIVSAKEALAWPPDCATMYIAGKLQTEKRHLLTSWMPLGGTVVLYGQY